MASNNNVQQVYTHHGEEGSGQFSKHTIINHLVIEKAVPLILSACVMHFKKKPRYTICDYGAADGGVSMNIIRQCIAQVKANDPNVEVQVLYEDLPSNDFKSLFYAIQGYIPHVKTYLKDYEGVYTAAIGTSFYEQCVPSGSVDLAISTIACNWLSRRPCNLKNCLVFPLCEDEVERQLFKEQGTKDWMTFLSHRAKELAPGGQCVTVLLALDEDGQYSGGIKSIKESLHEMMTIIWKEMMQEGIITKGEFVTTVFDYYTPTKHEILAPFKDEKSPVFKAGLRVVSIDIKITECPYQEEWSKNGKPDDPTAPQNYAIKFVEGIKTWSSHVFFSGLSDKRPNEERKKIVKEFYKRYEDIVAAKPEDHGNSIVAAYLHFQKLT